MRLERTRVGEETKKTTVIKRSYKDEKGKKNSDITAVVVSAGKREGGIVHRLM